jgi:hypothetical protein
MSNTANSDKSVSCRGSSDNLRDARRRGTSPELPRMPRLEVVISVIAIVSVCFALAKAQESKPAGESVVGKQILLAPDAIKWGPMPKEWVEGTRPAGFKGHSEVAIVQGDPARQGASYVIRIRSTLGSQIPPYWSSDDESITVLSGTLCLGLGTTFDENACRDFPAGSFLFLPKGVPHFGLTKGDVVQIQGTGPLKVHWVEIHTQDTPK